MRFHIITIFPDMFTSYLGESILARAIEGKKIKVQFYNPRDFVKDTKGNNYKPVDDKPYGGGPGMVMRAEPLIKAIEKAISASRVFSSGPRLLAKGSPRPLKKNSARLKIIHFAPSAKKFETTYAKNLVKKKYTDVIFICGRYEGIDARVKKIFKGDEISVGDYVLTGGELPAMVMIDCISRQIPGVLGKYESLEEERVSSPEVYTRPEILKHNNKNYKVPKVLLSGNHALIDAWKQKGK